MHPTIYVDKNLKVNYYTSITNSIVNRSYHLKLKIEEFKLRSVSLIKNLNHHKMDTLFSMFYIFLHIALLHF